MDSEDFHSEAVPRLCRGVQEYSWLLTRGYAEPSALKLVGDRYALTERQRMAVRRCACSDQALAQRIERQEPWLALRGGTLHLDGFNVITTVEAALGGAVVLLGRDGAARDLMGVHGTYRRVEETEPAIVVVGEWLERHGARSCRWWLDRPVSNSGRLKIMLLVLATERGWDWQVELVLNPDTVLAESGALIATADAGILDRGPRWLNLAREMVTDVGGAQLVDLSATTEPQ
jgi:hypothetical protein